MLETRMAQHATDLVIELLQNQHLPRDGQKERDDQVIGLIEKGFGQRFIVVAPHRRGQTFVMKGMKAVKRLAVQQPVNPVKPGVIEQDRRRQEQE